ncbi:peptidoglycan-binding domain-containing protein [Paracoccus everestensis]|uniref:peptidoglycan-binding domain-containing protein n=1 Tax=Paracoccus everestensis TaxID=2903900 RepID=UPI001F27A9B3|nr:peptidoglycan-binding protein [Paracoccus everestensis]
MVRSFCFSAVIASVFSISGPSAYADEKLGDIIGTIARTVLEQQQAAQEQALWAGVVENGSAAAYRQYLDAYPQGPNARNARDHLTKLGAATTATNGAAQAEAALGLRQSDRVAIQRRLAALGFYKSGIDGAFGAGTRRAVAAWQESRTLPRTGYLNAEQLRLLLGRAATAPASTPPLADNPVTSAAQTELNLGLTRPQRVQIQRDLIALGYDSKGADGLFGAGTREAIRAWQRNTGQRATGYMSAAQVGALHSDAEVRGSEATGGRAAAIDEDLLGLTRSERAEIQQRLIGLGYLKGRADGVFGASTRNALIRWQGDNGLKESGYLTAEQVRTLRAQARR